MSNQSREYLASYARALAKALIKYTNDDELIYLIKLFQQETKRICENRPSQALNDASFHLYCQYLLREGR